MKYRQEPASVIQLERSAPPRSSWALRKAPADCPGANVLSVSTGLSFQEPVVASDDDSDFFSVALELPDDGGEVADPVCYRDHLNRPLSLLPPPLPWLLLRLRE